MTAQIELCLMQQSRPRTGRAPVYFDTTRLDARDLLNAVLRAGRQDVRVLAAFRAHLVLSPSRCGEVLNRYGAPILLTSVRRSIANLTTAGVLRKTEKKVDGPHNAPEHLWELVERSADSLHARSAA